MKLLILITNIFTFTFTFSQNTYNFNQSVLLSPNPQQITNFYPVGRSAVGIGDVDNDGDQDMLITGKLSGAYFTSRLYLNDGFGSFNEDLTQVFQSFEHGTVSFFDIDNDNDLDLLLTGESVYTSFGLQPLTIMYKNDGFGNFTEILNTPFISVGFSSVSYADVDNDNDLDVFISGIIGANGVANLYLNDGNGVFSLSQDNNFIGVYNSSSIFLDVDNDNDLDLLVAGKLNYLSGTTNLYLNDGNGNFIEDQSLGLINVSACSIDAIDVDNDNDLDVVICGNEGGDISQVLTTKLYLNDGLGSFTEDLNSSFIGVYHSSLLFDDVDNDNDFDLILSGITISDTSVSVLYINDNGVFAESTANTFVGVSDCSVMPIDIDNDNDNDIIFTGRAINSSAYNYDFTSLYLNQGTGIFDEITSSQFEGVDHSSAIYADIDNDGDNDMLISGSSFDEKSLTNIYINDGVGNFSIDLNSSIINVQQASTIFGDIDNDGDEDLFITGMTQDNSLVSKLYLNDGVGIFVEDTNTFINVRVSSCAFADIDGDNDLDLLITGESSSVGLIDAPLTKLYVNNGLGDFQESNTNSFVNVASSSIEFSDIDGDNDLDLLITGDAGFSSPSNNVSKLYSNDGSGNYTEILNTGISNVGYSSISFCDVDNDNDNDLFITGIKNSMYISELYMNDGIGNFSIVASTPFIGVHNSSISFGDIDSDSDMDLLITGKLGTLYGANESISKLYTNDGNGVFTEAIVNNLNNVYNSSSFIFDSDGDSLDDIFISGFTDKFRLAAHLYKNTSCLGTEISTFSTLNDSICIGDSAVFLITGTPNAIINYQINQSIVQSIQLNNSGESNITILNVQSNQTIQFVGITNTVTNCSANLFLSESIYITPFVDAGVDQSICEGDSVTLIANTDGVSFLWDNGVIDNVPFLIDSTSSFILTAQNVNGCINQDTILVNFNPAPIIQAIVSDSSICSGESVLFNSSGGIDYTWDFGYINGYNYYLSASKYYVIEGTGQNGCIGKDSVYITVSPNPNVSINASLNAVCIGDSIALSGVGADSYVWNNGVTNGIYFYPINTNLYNVIGTNIYGCIDEDSVLINVNQIPIVQANVSDSSICYGESIIFNGSGAETYTWNYGVIDSSIALIYNSNYITVSGLDSNSCTNVDSVYITVNPSPNVTIIASLSTICLGDTVTLSGVGADSYVWNNGVNNGLDFYPINTNWYNVIGTNVYNCIDEDSVLINVNQIPIVQANVSDSSICYGESIIFNGSGAETYTWNYGVIDSSMVLISNSNYFTVSGLDSNSCTNIDSVYITVNPSPNVSINASLITICLGDTITLNGIGADDYVWDNDVVNGIEFYPIITNLYNVIGTNSFGCTDSDTVTLFVNTVNTNVIDQDSMIVSLANNASFQWFNCNQNYIIPNEINSIFTPTIDDSYAVIVSQSGCVDTSICVNFSTLVVTNDKEIFVSIYPNPTINRLDIESSALIENVKIVNVMGQNVYEKNNVDMLNVSVNSSSLSIGVYFVYIKTVEGISIKKLNKN